MAWLPSLARWTRIAGGRTPPPSGRVFMITLQCACAVWSVAERQHGTEGGRRTGLRRRMYTEKPRQKGIPCNCIAPVARQGRHGIITVLGLIATNAYSMPYTQQLIDALLRNSTAEINTTVRYILTDYSCMHRN